MIQVIPAIDIINGVCVRLEEGDFERKTSYDTPVLDIARYYEDAGFKRLHLVDLDGAKAGKPVNMSVLASIARETDLEVDVGGGLASMDSVKEAFDTGAAQVNLGTAAVKNPELLRQVIREFGSDSVILSADVRNGIVQVRGWLERTELSLSDLLKSFAADGLKYVTTTDIARDGMLSGPALDLYREIKSQHRELSIIASGGVRSAEDVQALDELGIYGVIVGKALLSGRVTPSALKEFLA